MASQAAEPERPRTARRTHFYTPPGIARLMARGALELLGGLSPHVPVCLDPACGDGRLLAAALDVLCREHGVSAAAATLALRGCDIDQAAVIRARELIARQALNLGVRRRQLPDIAAALERNLQVRDALLDAPGMLADCLLVNPPYVRACRSPNRGALRRAYATATGVFDVSVPFIELGLRLLRPGGAFALLVSSKLLVAEYARELRRLLAERATFERLLDLEVCVGADSGARVCQVLAIGRSQPPVRGLAVRTSRPAHLDDAQSDAAPVLRPQDDLLGRRWPVLSPGPADLDLIHRIRRGTRPLAEMASVRGGVRGFDYHACCTHLIEGCTDPAAWPVVTPGNTRPYRAPLPLSVRLAGRTWRRPALPDRPPPIREHLWELFARPKVAVKGIGARPAAAWVPEPTVLLVAMWGIWADEEVGWALVGLLNSLPIAWLHRTELRLARIPQGSWRMPLAWLRDVPVPGTDLEPLAALALRRAHVPAQDADRLQHLIDEAALRAYGLRPADRHSMGVALEGEAEDR